MRAALAALLLIATPAVGSECAYFNQTGQSVAWDGETRIVFDPLFTDKVGCSLTPVQNTNGYTANCGGWSDVLVVGQSTPDAPFVDIVVFQNTFFWYRCAKDGA
jgi:hypothetical protein